MRGLGRHYELEVTCRGDTDETTGYFINIKDIDAAVRTAAVPLIAAACSPDGGGGVEPPSVVMRRFMPALATALGGSVQSVRWRLSPFYSVQMQTTDTSVVLLRQRFEIAASHRLHMPTLSDEENRRVFGKCNNPSGHGHNYVIEPCVAVALDAAGRPPYGLDELEVSVEQAILTPFDHAHLNTDTLEFAPGAANPSVENISKVFFERLAPLVDGAGKGARLRSLTVWETEKTSATYPG